MNPEHIVIVGGGFAGLEAAKALGSRPGITVTLLDRRNHHLFQPLLYQVATAGLSPAEIAVPLRSVLARHSNITVLMEEVTAVDLKEGRVQTPGGAIGYDRLILALGVGQGYLGHDEWQAHAPGLKSLEQATEIRRRVFTAFEMAEKETDPGKQQAWLTFVVVGGGPTGVELAGALGELTRFTLAKDFRRIDPGRTRILLVEGGPRLLPMFDPELSRRTQRDLESLGVSVWTGRSVQTLDARGVGLIVPIPPTPEKPSAVSAPTPEFIASHTILWAAGVKTPELSKTLGTPTDRGGRLYTEADLSLPGHPNVYVLGDMAACQVDARGMAVGPVSPGSRTLPGLSPVAIQQGRHVAKNILASRMGKSAVPFRYVDKGSMATIGRGRAVGKIGKLRITGMVGWLLWLFVHLMYLVGFKNRVLVFIQWASSFLTWSRGARLITQRPPNP